MPESRVTPNNKPAMSLFSKRIEERILSIDIETSGLDPRTDWIWSIGVAKQKGPGKEFWVNPPSQERLKSLFENQIFSIENYFEEYKAALKEGRTLPTSKAIDKALSEIDKSSIVLIQNANFENRFIAAAISDKTAERYAKKFAFISDFSKNSLFYTPPEVTQKRHEIMRATALIRSGIGNGADLAKDINMRYKEMISAYSKAIGSGKGAVTVDLMDISGAMYAAATEKGFFDPRDVRTGLSVDFLSRVLLGVEESHKAYDDAKVQLRLFNEMKSMIDELYSGRVSEETVAKLARIKAAQPYENARTLFASIRNTLEEIDRTGHTKLIDPLNLKYKTITINGSEYKFLAVDYNDVPRTSNQRRAILHAASRFQNVNTAYVDVNEATRKILNAGDIKKKIQLLKQLEAEAGGKVSAALTGSMPRSEYITDRAIRIKNELVQAIKGTTQVGRKRRLGFGLAAAAITLGAIALSKEEKEQRKTQEQEISYQELQKIKQKRMSNQSTFSMFSSTELYHGTGFYAWNEAKRSHNYGYTI